MTSLKIALLSLSAVASAWVVWRLWRSGEPLFFKWTLSLIAFIPVFGPILALWLVRFPERAPDPLQDTGRFAADVTDRWGHVFRERDPVVRFRRWRELMRR